MAMEFDLPNPTLGIEGVAMTTSTPFHRHGFSLTRLRLALHLRPPGAQASAAGSALSTPRIGWIDQLAAWSDRQPPAWRRARK